MEFIFLGLKLRLFFYNDTLVYTFSALRCVPRQSTTLRNSRFLHAAVKRPRRGGLASVLSKNLVCVGNGTPSVAKGSVLDYKNPFNPVAEDDWEIVR